VELVRVDAIESVTFRHEEGNEREKIGVKRRIMAFYGCKLLKKKEEMKARFSVRMGFRPGGATDVYPATPLIHLLPGRFQ
jgi:hypothetical protein